MNKDIKKIEYAKCIFDKHIKNTNPEYWCDYGYPEERANYSFPKVFEIPISKYNVA